MKFTKLSIILLTIMSSSNATQVNILEEGKRDRAHGGRRLSSVYSAQNDEDMHSQKYFEPDGTWLGTGKQNSSGLPLTVTVHRMVCHDITDWGVNEDDELQLFIGNRPVWPGGSRGYYEISPGKSVEWDNSWRNKLRTKVSDRKEYCLYDRDWVELWGGLEKIGCATWEEKDVGNPNCTSNPEWNTTISPNWKGGGGDYYIRFFFSCTVPVLYVTVHRIVCHDVTDWGYNEDDEIRLYIGNKRVWPSGSYYEISPGKSVEKGAFSRKEIESKVSDRKEYCLYDVDGWNTNEKIGCATWEEKDVGNPNCATNPEWSTTISPNWKGGGGDYYIRFYFSCNLP